MHSCGEPRPGRTRFLLVLAAAATAALTACGPRGPAALLQSEEGLWQRVGAELAAAADRQPDVTRVLLIRQEIKPDFNLGPAQDLMEAAFRREVGGGSRRAPEVVTVALPAMPPPDPKDLTPRSGYHRVEPAFLGEALQRGGPFSLVVSLLGEPTGRPPRGTAWPPIVCFAWEGSTNLAEMIRAGAVAAAVAPRHDTPAKGEDDWFERRYTVVTPARVDAWLPRNL